MARFFGNHPGTRQDRPFRRRKPMTQEEHLASLEKGLEWKIQAFGPDHWLTERQREIIAHAQGQLTEESRNDCETIWHHLGSRRPSDTGACQPNV